MVAAGRQGSTSLAAQWLKLCLPIQGVRVQSLVRELRSTTPLSQRNKTESDIVTNSIKNLKMVHIKNKKSLKINMEA